MYSCNNFECISLNSEFLFLQQNKKIKNIIEVFLDFFLELQVYGYSEFISEFRVYF